MSTELRHRTLLILEGHIIDSMILPQVMDLVMDLGGNFNIEELRVGQHKDDTSFCRMEVVAPDAETLDRIVRRAKELGAQAAEEAPAKLVPVEKLGVYPEGFYSTTNLPTYVLVGGKWLPVQKQEMDCAIAVDEAEGSARCIPFYEARPGVRVVVGHSGVRVVPLERSRQTEIFTFMASYGSFFWPLIMIKSDYLRTLPIGMLYFDNVNQRQTNLLMAASVMNIAPLIVLFVVTQKFLVKGIQLGAVKG